MNTSSHATPRETLQAPNRPQDADLAAIALSAIACLTTVPVDWLKVKAQDGWLHLQGEVNSDSERIIVEEVTRLLTGVRGVTNSVKVRPFPCCPA